MVVVDILGAITFSSARESSVRSFVFSFCCSFFVFEGFAGLDDFFWLDDTFSLVVDFFLDSFFVALEDFEGSCSFWLFSLGDSFGIASTGTCEDFFARDLVF